MTPEQEAKARELLYGTAGRAPSTTVPAPMTTTPVPEAAVAPTITPKSDLESYKEARKRAEQDAKLRKKAEDKARKEMERMQAETRAKAKEDLRRKAEAEARAKKETEATVASVRTKERDEFRKRSGTAPGETAAIVTPADNSVAVAKAVPAPEEVKSAPPNSVVSEPKKAASTTSARPEEDPAFPAAKRQQLMKLLNDYRQDKITPEEYHSGRAKIIASP